MESREDGGHVVNVASTAGIGSSIAYAASKGALVTMGLSLARALGPKIRVNTVCPGFIRGDWLRKGLGDKAYEAPLDRQLKSTPLHQTATAESVAEAILQFISGSPAVTGQTLIVDGGLHLTRASLVQR